MTARITANRTLEAHQAISAAIVVSSDPERSASMIVPGSSERAVESPTRSTNSS
jgi:hypothetical protein